MFRKAGKLKEYPDMQGAPLQSEHFEIGSALSHCLLFWRWAQKQTVRNPPRCGRIRQRQASDFPLPTLFQSHILLLNSGQGVGCDVFC